MNPREVYERNPANIGREAACRLRPHEWDLFLRLDGLRTLQEISIACKIDLQWIVTDIERLQQLELVRVVELDLEGYQQRFVRNREGTPAAAPSRVSRQADPMEGKRVSFSLRRGEASPTDRSTESAGKSLPSASGLAASPAAVSEHHLKPLLDFITSHAGGGTVGQLAAYRVFLKVPNDLLRQAGIRSLNLVSEDFVIRDHTLWRVLLNAVEEVLGKRFVPSAVPAAELAAA